MCSAQVLFLRQRQKFETVDTSNFCVNRQYKIFSEDADIDVQYRRLLEHRCKLCLSIEPFRTLENLRAHVQREHTLFYCDLCVNNLKVSVSTIWLISRKSLQKMAKNTANLCENRKNHGKITASNHGTKDHYTVVMSCDMQRPVMARNSTPELVIFCNIIKLKI